MISARDALVFVVIALVAVVLIEGIIISNVTAPPATLVRTSTLTVDPTGSSASTVTVVSTSTVPPTTSTETYTTVFNFTLTNSPTTSNSNTTTSTTQNSTSSTGTNTTTSTTSSTLTPTTNASGTYVIIPAGTATSGEATKGYDPDHIVVVLGINNTVTWVNEDSVPHTVTSRSSIQPFNSGQIQPGGTFTFTFTSLGSYTYTCDNFPWMSGIVTVEYG